MSACFALWTALLAAPSPARQGNIDHYLLDFVEQKEIYDVLGSSFPAAASVNGGDDERGLPCRDEHVFEAASYVKTEKDLNMDPSSYFPFLKDVDVKLEGSEEQIPASVSLLRDPAPQVTLNPTTQSIRLILSINISATQSLHTYKPESWTLSQHCHRVSIDYDCTHGCWGCLWICNCNTCTKHTESCTDQKDPVAASGCNGIGIFNAWVQLEADIDLLSSQQDLDWKQHKTLNKSLEGSCKDFLPQVQHFQVSPVVEKIQERLQKSWGGMRARQQLSVGHATQLSLQFLRPKIVSIDGTHAIKGSIMACMNASGSRYYVAHPNNREVRQTCKERLAKQVPRVTDTRRIFLSLGWPPARGTSPASYFPAREVPTSKSACWVRGWFTL